MTNPDPKHSRQDRRLNRQFKLIEKFAPVLRSPLKTIRARGWWIVRVPIALTFIAGGLVSFLPIFGLWMLPLGLMLLAIDLPVMREPITTFVIRTRRRIDLWRRNRRG